MSRDANAVFEAIARWEEALLIDGKTAGALRDEAARNAESGTKRFSQYLVAVTGGVALLIAGAIFLDWAWPQLSVGAQSALLGIGGILVLILGVRIEGSRRWLPASYLMQTSGLGLLFGAFTYGESVWADQSAVGIVMGVLSLATPIVLAPRAMKRNVVMPAVHLAMSFGFLGVFLDRATPVPEDQIVWFLDGLLLVSVVGLVALLRSDPHGHRHPWALNAFVTAMFFGFFLVAGTTLNLFGSSNSVVFALDAWLAISVALTLWAIHRGPVGLRREWFGELLAAFVLVWIPFGFFSAYEALDAPAELAFLLVGGVGVVGFVYGNREGLRSLMGVSTLTFIVAMWVWAVDRGGALGAATALLVTAALLFWVSGKIGEADRGTDAPRSAG